MSYSIIAVRCVRPGLKLLNVDRQMNDTTTRMARPYGTTNLKVLLFKIANVLEIGSELRFEHYTNGLHF